MGGSNLKRQEPPHETEETRRKSSAFCRWGGANNGESIEAIYREHNITETSYYRWKNGEMKLQDAWRY